MKIYSGMRFQAFGHHYYAVTFDENGLWRCRDGISGKIQYFTTKRICFFKSRAEA